ncbi:MAG TPA: MFS transporter [Trebonia sp.]
MYAFIRAASNGWGDSVTIASFGAAAVLLAAFLAIETRAAEPITPLRLFADAGRSGSFVARLLLVAGMFGVFFFLTQFLQDVLGFSPIQAGIAFLPMTIALFAVSRFMPRLLPVVGPQRLMIAGMLPVIAGMAWLSRVSPATSYWSGVFEPMLLIGIGMGVVFVPLTTVSLAGVRREDSGAASSMVNVMQQVGGSLGLAVLVAVYGTATRNAAAHPAAGLSGVALQHHVLAHGMSTAFGLAAIFDVAVLSWSSPCSAPASKRCRTPRPASSTTRSRPTRSGSSGPAGTRPVHWPQDTQARTCPPGSPGAIAGLAR